MLGGMFRIRARDFTCLTWEREKKCPGVRVDSPVFTSALRASVNSRLRFKCTSEQSYFNILLMSSLYLYNMTHCLQFCQLWHYCHECCPIGFGDGSVCCQLHALVFDFWWALLAVHCCGSDVFVWKEVKKEVYIGIIYKGGFDVLVLWL